MRSRGFHGVVMGFMTVSAADGDGGDDDDGDDDFMGLLWVNSGE